MKLSNKKVFELYKERQHKAELKVQEAKLRLEEDLIVVKGYNSRGLLLQLLRNEFVIEGSPADKLLNFFGIRGGYMPQSIEDDKYLKLPFMGRFGMGNGKVARGLSKAFAFIRPGGVGGIVFEVVKPVLISSGIALFEKMLGKGIARLFSRRKRPKRS